MVQSFTIRAGNGNIFYTGSSVADLPELTTDMFSITVRFHSNDDMSSFCDKFPKSMNIKGASLTSLDGIVYSLTCNKARISRSTGEQNECGDKRMSRLYNELKNSLKN